MMCEAEAEYAAQHGPKKHASTARLIDDCMRLPGLLPRGLCNCDEGRMCRPHAAIINIVERAHYSGRPNRARSAVERFVRRVSR